MKKKYTVILKIGEQIHSEENPAFYFEKESEAINLSDLFFKQGYDVSYIVTYGCEVKNIFGDDGE